LAELTQLEVVDDVLLQLIPELRLTKRRTTGTHQRHGLDIDEVLQPARPIFRAVRPPQPRPVPPQPAPVVFREIEIDLDGWSCPTCLEGFDENVVYVDCGHAFHRHCVESDLANRAQAGFLQCPVCRQFLPLPLSLLSVEVEDVRDDVSVASVAATTAVSLQQGLANFGDISPASSTASLRQGLAKFGDISPARSSTTTTTTTTTDSRPARDSRPASFYEQRSARG